MSKVYTITVEKIGREYTSTYTGTIKDLINRVFGYTIECNGKSKNARTLEQLLSRLNGGTSYWSMYTTYTGRLATADEIKEYQGGKHE